MSAKTEILAAVVRILADQTTLIRKPTPFEETLNTWLGVESYDRRAAREIEAELERTANAVKKFRINRKFKKITENV